MYSDKRERTPLDDAAAVCALFSNLQLWKILLSLYVRIRIFAERDDDLFREGRERASDFHKVN